MIGIEFKAIYVSKKKQIQIEKLFYSNRKVRGFEITEMLISGDSVKLRLTNENAPSVFAKYHPNVYFGNIENYLLKMFFLTEMCITTK